MTQRTIPSTFSLSFGQLFLFQETKPNGPVLYRQRNRRRKSARRTVNLRKIALFGLTFGFAISVLVQSFCLQTFRW